MFFSVLLILATIWTSSDGALSCKTDDDLECIFPFKSSASSSEYNQCKAASKGRTWCATAVQANLVYSAWGYCNLDTCKEVQTIAEATEQIEKRGSCYGCIEHAAHSRPPHWQSLECLKSCVFNPEPQACFQCLVGTATRQCLAPCGQPELLKSIALPDPDGSKTCTKITPTQAVQSSTFNDGVDSPGVATNAIDGNAATFSVTAGGETFPWIAVQLTDDDTSVPVKRVVITNIVQFFGSRLIRMQVFVADQIPASSSVSFSAEAGVHSMGFFQGPGKDGEIIEVTSDIAKGRFVVIQMQDVDNLNLNNKLNNLNLAEITIYSN